MSLYDVRERTKRVAGWLREDREKIYNVRERMNESLALPIDSSSPKQHEYLLTTFKLVLNKYADVVGMSADLNLQVSRSVKLLSEVEKSVENGYIDAVSGELKAMRILDYMNSINSALETIIDNLRQDFGELALADIAMTEIISTGDTRGNIKELAFAKDRAREDVDKIGEWIHQMEIETLAMHRILHGVAGIDTVITDLAEWVRTGYLDFDEYEDTET